MKYIDGGADISACGKYRYSLWREWGGLYTTRSVLKKSCLFIMLNPSTADAKTDDPTIRRCVSFAKSFGYDWLEVVNLFAFRATNPKQLLALNHNDDPVGVRNQEVIEQAASRTGIIIAAWGAHGSYLGQDETVLDWLDENVDLVHALGITNEGHPRHPLYLRNGLKPFYYTGQVYTA